MTTPPIYIVSGGAGASGEQVLRTALAQFGETDMPVIIVPHVREKHELEAAVSEAHRSGGTIVHTLVDAQVRHWLVQLTRQYNVPAIDLMGSLLSHLGTKLGREPLGQPGLYRQLRESYFERIEAIEYTVNHDDGRNPDELHLAEIVLTGISRVGKTPLSIYLSVQGWKTANVPLVPGIDPPPQLFEIDQRRVIGLTIDPEQLVIHRRWRQQHLKLGSGADYVDLDAIYEQIEAARRVFRRGGFTTIDITRKPIEESAADIIALLSRRFNPG
ncbi:MAG: kinase/pyrophosphorylase [Anaerolineae bacterium]|nr:kinase/pyrophosphorylase [Anaerolineae bacterium]